MKFRSQFNYRKNFRRSEKDPPMTSFIIPSLLIFALVVPISSSPQPCQETRVDLTLGCYVQGSNPSGCENYYLAARFSLTKDQRVVTYLNSWFDYTNTCGEELKSIYYTNSSPNPPIELPVNQKGPVLRKNDRIVANFTLTLVATNMEGDIPETIRISIDGVVDTARRDYSSRCRWSDRAWIQGDSDICIHQTKTMSRGAHRSGSFDAKKSSFLVEGLPFPLPTVTESGVWSDEQKYKINTCGSRCIDISLAK